MSTLNLYVSKPQIPSLPQPPWIGLKRLPFSSPSKTITITSPNHKTLFSIIQAASQNSNRSPFFPTKPSFRRPSPCVSAGRSKKKPGGSSTGRIEGNAEVRREAKRNARRRSRRLSESLYYRLKNPSRNHADNFTEEELQMIGLGYDRMVRFMEKDDPNLRHPYDWYKYGQYGPYSWRGIVLGDPIRGRISDDCVSMFGEVKDHEEWEEIDKHEMAMDFTRRVKSMDKSIGFKYYWVFVRHPRWRISESPWEQWTLICEVVLESGNERLDKWNLMARLGNKVRALITQCAAWMRPDIIYRKRPIYQCRFEPQNDFFKALGPMLDPSTENQYLFDLELEDGRVERCTYFGGLCKFVRVNQKAFVDDVVKAYEKLSDEKKSKCLQFLLSNHPVELLHPYTKEWKVKLEEMELGCDAPDETSRDDEGAGNGDETEIVDWVEDGDGDDSGDDGEEDDAVMDEEDGDEDLGIEEEEETAEERESYWKEGYQKALQSSEAMQKLVTKSIGISTEYYNKQLRMMDEQQKAIVREEVQELEGNGNNVKKPETDAKKIRQTLENVGFGLRRRILKSKIPPELFRRAAVRPFTYRNLVKEIVLMRHAIIDGEVSGQR
eukprot:TRINITY_DN26091_c1_g1_i1.p1 TRINITY_DN26091_c1_g1~~TRINITY_DN26091_c1_g1_i1.p1  ORF type:complete len:607 (-),score=136.57 TRINITY_DN26091_c1_g1_i1:539-2359(-)